jgi:hypothetical protein
MIIKVDNTVLAGEGRDGPIGIRISRGIVIQEAPYLRAASQGQFDRKNARTLVTFTRSFLFDDLADAEVFYLENANDTLMMGLVTLIAKSSSKEVERYLQNAVVHTFNGRQIGVTVMVDYEIVGGKILTERPS